MLSSSPFVRGISLLAMKESKNQWSKWCARLRWCVRLYFGLIRQVSTIVLLLTWFPLHHTLYQHNNGHSDSCALCVLIIWLLLWILVWFHLLVPSQLFLTTWIPMKHRNVWEEGESPVVHTLFAHVAFAIILCVLLPGYIHNIFHYL